jgi:hypothetical protein
MPNRNNPPVQLDIEAMADQMFVRGERWDVAVGDPVRIGDQIQVVRARIGEQLMQAQMAPWMRKPAEGKRGEELFRLILSGIREVYDHDAVIAGGAVRDFAAGVSSCKDVDVFLHMPWKDFNACSDELGWQAVPRLTKNEKYKKGKTGASSMGFMATHRAMSQVQNVPVDLVFIEKPLDKDVVATFPVFAQRGVWTLSGGLILSPEAKEDIANKTFTIDPTITDKAKVKAVLAKVNEWKKREGYSDWKIVEPDVPDWWEAKKANEEEAKASKTNTNWWHSAIGTTTTSTAWKEIYEHNFAEVAPQIEDGQEARGPQEQPE